MNPGSKPKFLYVIPTFNNPTGGSISDEERCVPATVSMLLRKLSNNRLCVRYCRVTAVLLSHCCLIDALLMPRCCLVDALLMPHYCLIAVLLLPR